MHRAGAALYFTDLVLWRFAGVVLVCWGCGHPPAPDRTIAPSVVSAGTEHALVDALADLDPVAPGWLEERVAGKTTPPPVAVVRAIDALVAWRRANVAFVPPCRKERAKLGPELVWLGFAVTALATDSHDPALEALGKLRVELQRPGNTGLSMLASLLIASAIVDWVSSHRAA
ncbi:MAG: hypothetical protein H0V17_07995, partial [Deltaproteobacteria bacterium]|nr:hypothetical protein [Deltaproteobacteria bacterium]